ncbi:transposase [Streptomyces sp. NPDC001903]|uniref:transposase n=1 Tax=Streptomyces sp. NPDC001903 TaxID=3364622 RepID=UPI00367BEF2B
MEDPPRLPPQRRRRPPRHARHRTDAQPRPRRIDQRVTLRPTMPEATRRSFTGQPLGKTRWVVERSFAWLHQFKRLRIRYEIRADLHQGFLELACSIVCLRRLRAAF